MITKNLDSHVTRNAFNEFLYTTMVKFQQERDLYPDDTVLGVKRKNMEVRIDSVTKFSSEWDSFPLDGLYRSREDNSAFEATTDAIFDIASSFYFVR